MIKWFVKYAVPKSLMKNPLIAPNDAPDSVVKGLPPATVILAELDPLRSEGQAYAYKLRRNGVETNMRLYPGVTHEFFGMAAIVNKTKDAVAFAATDLKKPFAK
jgi:acetyl esterase